jgi:hypothetical protein
MASGASGGSIVLLSKDLPERSIIFQTKKIIPDKIQRLPGFQLIHYCIHSFAYLVIKLLLLKCKIMLIQ